MSGLYSEILKKQEVKNKAALDRIKGASRGQPPPYYDQQQIPPQPMPAAVEREGETELGDKTGIPQPSILLVSRL
jgi:hypothetical protein